MALAPELVVEVVYALPEAQAVVQVTLAPGATVGEALTQSGLLRRFRPDSGLAHRIGIFGKIVTENALLNDGDRVEIYRSLTVDPKEARRRRVTLRVSKQRGA